MYKYFPVIFLLLHIYGCIPKKENNQILNETKNNHPDSISTSVEQPTDFIDSAYFKFFNLTEFNINDWYPGRMNNELISVTNEAVIRYFQNDRINSENVNLSDFWYYSLQKNTPEEKIITIIEGDEICCYNLHYLIYNNGNQLLSDNIVAGRGGDGLWQYNQYGKFTNDSTYVVTQVDSEEFEFDNGSSQIRIDSVITNFRFRKGEAFEELKHSEFTSVIFID